MKRPLGRRGLVNLVMEKSWFLPGVRNSPNWIEQRRKHLESFWKLRKRQSCWRGIDLVINVVLCKRKSKQEVNKVAGDNLRRVIVSSRSKINKSRDECLRNLIDRMWMPRFKMSLHKAHWLYQYLIRMQFRRNSFHNYQSNLLSCHRKQCQYWISLSKWKCIWSKRDCCFNKKSQWRVNWCAILIKSTSRHLIWVSCSRIKMSVMYRHQFMSRCLVKTR